MKVNNEENKILNEYDKTSGIIKDKEEAYKIYEGHLRKDQVINFEIRMWMGEEVELSDEVKNKTFRSKVTVEAVVENTAGIYKEDILNGADPVLKEGLIPVTINNEGKVTRADTNKKWYNYANQEWANAVILVDDYEDPGEGKEIPEDKIESYFVWIPKYSYQLWDLGEYDGLTEIDESKPHTIPIRFGTTNTIDTKGECATPMNDDNTQGLSGESKNCKIGDYMTHPAFISFGVNGLWVGKFETGYKDATDAKTAQVNPTDEADAKTKANKVIIKPNVYSWRGIQPSYAHLISYNYQRELDSHMMKNTEWGAVAYLQHSLYGSREKVRINNNSSYLTGYAAKNEPTCFYLDYSSECSQFGQSEKGLDSNYSYNYFNKLSVSASTTNNYTGIYDMSGGTWEYMLGFLVDTGNNYYVGNNDTINTNFIGKLNNPSSGSNKNKNEWTKEDGGIEIPKEKKYYDIYKYSTGWNDYNRRILGDATGEMGPFQTIKYTLDNPVKTSNQSLSSWYNESIFMLNNGVVSIRGESYSRGILAGIFNLSTSQGTAGVHGAFRIVLAI